MIVVSTLEALRAARAGLNGSVGAVYTMGALHDGHLALVEAARAQHDAIVATLFVNPSQFNAAEDLTHYPRRLEADLALFKRSGVDVVFTPSPEAMYPTGFQTTVSLSQVTQGLEGARRPGHFDGVATVVAKLFNLTQPHAAYFGQKDAQQVVVIRQMVRDLNYPLNIIVCPTHREMDGLAMSSRNIYLSSEERRAASVIYRALQTASSAYDRGQHEPAMLIDIVRETLASEPLIQPDYISLNDPQTLETVIRISERPVLLSVTAALGETHLLDNLLLPAFLNTQDGLTRWLGA